MSGLLELSSRPNKLSERDLNANAGPSSTPEVSATIRIVSSKPKKVQLTPLHVNIPIDLDNALRACMMQQQIEKTEIIVLLLRAGLKEWL